MSFKLSKPLREFRSALNTLAADHDARVVDYGPTGGGHVYFTLERCGIERDLIVPHTAGDTMRGAKNNIAVARRIIESLGAGNHAANAAHVHVVRC